MSPTLPIGRAYQAAEFSDDSDGEVLQPPPQLLALRVKHTTSNNKEKDVEQDFNDNGEEWPEDGGEDEDEEEVEGREACMDFEAEVHQLHTHKVPLSDFPFLCRHLYSSVLLGPAKVRCSSYLIYLSTIQFEKLGTGSEPKTPAAGNSRGADSEGNNPM